MRSSSGYIFVLISACSQIAKAYTTFEPECTNPKEAVNFVSSPPTRGTLDILWSSLFTIFACTWTILHPNVPEQRDGQDPGILGDLKWKIKANRDKVIWMFGAILAPELLLFFAVSRLMCTREQHAELKKYADGDGVPWTLAHTTFANMGGFVIRGSSDRVAKDHSSEIPVTQIQPRITDDWYILDPNTILRLRAEGHIILPCIHNAEMDDHSKGDLFTKGIAAIQIFWSIASAITRAIRGLAISQLEISVIAFSVCALLIYVCYWSSPKDVLVPITFLEWVGPIPPVITEIIKEADADHVSETSRAETGQKPFSNGFFQQNNSRFDEYILVFGALVFGAVHLLAWNFAFPTPAERIVWRATSVYCSLAGALFFAVTKKHLPEPYHTLPALGVIVPYILARLFLIVETFRTLLFLPPSAYIATWTSSVPMFG
jgi:hypothetical protein